MVEYKWNTRWSVEYTVDPTVEPTRSCNGFRLLDPSDNLELSTPLSPVALGCAGERELEGGLRGVGIKDHTEAY